MDDDVTLTIVAPKEIPFVPKAQGIDELVDVCRRNYAMMAEMNPTVQVVVAQGELVVCILRDRARYAESGEPFDMHAAQELTFGDGKVARIGK